MKLSLAMQMIQAGVETLVCVIHKLTNSIWNKKEWPEGVHYCTSSQDG
jgi:hypothetical protein